MRNLLLLAVLLSGCATSSQSTGGSGEGACAPAELVGRTVDEARECYGPACSSRRATDYEAGTSYVLATFCVSGECGECYRYVTFRVDGDTISSEE